MTKCDGDNCKAYCCSYVSVHIDTPRSKVDFDEIRWFVSHENITVYKDDDNDWIVEVVTPCKFLENNRCSIYETRPNVCRDYDPETCTRNSEETPVKILFKEPDEVLAFVAKRWKSNKRGKKKKKDN